MHSFQKGQAIWEGWSISFEARLDDFVLGIKHEACMLIAQHVSNFDLVWESNELSDIFLVMLCCCFRVTLHFDVAMALCCYS